MTKEQLAKIESMLKERGYRKYNQRLHREDYMLAKGFGKEENHYEENRSLYQVMFLVYDFTKYGDYNNGGIGLMVSFDVSRTVDDRADMEINVDENLDIEFIEKLAKGFYKFIDERIKI